jgi:predicted esterase
MQQHAIKITSTAHYYTLGEPGPHVRRFWMVCHGYAQLADAFLEELRVLDDGVSLIVAPEAPHYFYKRGFTGDIGAVWMTTRHRLAAIADYTHYLDAIYRHFIPQLPPDVHIVVLGFSQGTATVCRWLAAQQPHFHDLVLWAGVPPKDVDYAAAHAYFSTKRLILLYGTADPFITPDRLEEVHAIEATHQIDFDEQAFEGAHEVPETVLRALLEKMGLN